MSLVFPCASAILRTGDASMRGAALAVWARAGRARLSRDAARIAVPAACSSAVCSLSRGSEGRANSHPVLTAFHSPATLSSSFRLKEGSFKNLDAPDGEAMESSRQEAGLQMGVSIQQQRQIEGANRVANAMQALKKHETSLAAIIREATAEEKPVPEEARQIPHSAVTLSFLRLGKEASIKLARSRRATAGWRYVLFFVIYAITVIMQKNAWRSVLTSNALLDFMVGAAYPDCGTSAAPLWSGEMEHGDVGPGPCEGLDKRFELKSFLDLVTVSDIWDWLENLFIPSFYQEAWENGKPRSPLERNEYLMRMRPIGPFRWIQERALPGSSTVGDLSKDCIAYAVAPIDKFTPSCFDPVMAPTQ